MSSPFPPVRGPARRPSVATAAALLLVLCAVLQGVLFIALTNAGAYDGFPPNVWVCSTFVGLPSFAAAAVWVWRDLRGARVMIWLVAFMAAPCCIGFGAGLVPGSSSPPASDTVTSGGYPYEGAVGGANLVAAWIAFVLSAVALIGALVLVMLPSSGTYLRGRSEARLPESSPPYLGDDIGRE